MPEIEREISVDYETVAPEKVQTNDLKAIQCKFNDFKIVFFTIGGQGAEGCLIYVAMSKCKKERRGGE